jgi:hypothetical protein
MKRIIFLLLFGTAWCSDPAKPDALTPSIVEALEKDIIEHPIEPVVPRRQSTTPPPSPRNVKNASSAKDDAVKVAVRRGCIVL